MGAPMFVLGGVFGPRESFPDALQLLGDWQPLTTPMTCSRTSG